MLIIRSVNVRDFECGSQKYAIFKAVWKVNVRGFFFGFVQTITRVYSGNMNESEASHMEYDGIICNNL